MPKNGWEFRREELVKAKQSTKEIYMDMFSAATLQEDGSICCPTCGSWTQFDDLIQNEFTLEITCSLCRDKE
jgi:predicted  nucleic acid-binding Zn ribbon protein